MKKEEFLTNLRKKLSVLEEKEIQDIVGEYEQHIDMKMKEGLSEEDAIKDFGDFKELTAGILEAYHVKSDYSADKKNIDFDKVKEESRKATEKATSALGKGAGALGRGAGASWKWCGRQIKRLWNFIRKPFTGLHARICDSRKRAEGRGFFGKAWLLVLEFCRFAGRCVVWCCRLMWNAFWFFMSIFAGLGTLACIFLLGILLVLIVMGYPVAGVIMITIGGGLVSSSIMLLCFALIKKKPVREDNGDITRDFDDGDSKNEGDSWEYPEEQSSQAKQITVNSYREVPNHA